MTQLDSNCDQKYYKVINSNGHHGLKYQPGLNVDPLPFTPYGHCAEGAIYFTTYWHIPSFLDFGTMVAELEPRAKDGSPFEPICDEHYRSGKCDRFCNSFKAPAIFITAMYPMREFKGWQSVLFCQNAIEQRISSLRYIPYNTHTVDLFTDTLKRNGSALRYVPEELRTYESCLAAVQQYGGLLDYVPYELRTFDMCLAAVKNSRHARRYIPGEISYEEICRQVDRDNNPTYYWVVDKLRAWFSKPISHVSL